MYLLVVLSRVGLTLLLALLLPPMPKIASADHDEVDSDDDEVEEAKEDAGLLARFEGANADTCAVLPSNDRRRRTVVVRIRKRGMYLAERSMVVIVSVWGRVFVVFEKMRQENVWQYLLLERTDTF